MTALMSAVHKMSPSVRNGGTLSGSDIEIWVKILDILSSHKNGTGEGEFLSIFIEEFQSPTYGMKRKGVPPAVLTLSSDGKKNTKTRKCGN